MLFLLTLACTPPSEPTSKNLPDTVTEALDDPTLDDTGSETGTDTAPDLARWTFLVFMDGDNNLESYVTHDLNELEEVGSTEGVNVVVQADRIDGFADDDGDWTGTRRYVIEGDHDVRTVTTPVTADLGELDMGDPAVLADFLAWGAENYPAEHYALIMWNHGDSWSLAPDGETGEGVAPPSISSDDTSGTVMSIAEGDFQSGLDAHVAAYGRLDVLGFDACNMGSWEVAHAMQDYAVYMSAAETTVGWEGFMYADALALLRDDADADASSLADTLSRDAVEKGGENTHAAINLDAMGELSAALDGLAGAVLDDPAVGDKLLAYRDVSATADEVWHDYYLDVGDFAARVGVDEDPALAALGNRVVAAIGEAVLTPYSQERYAWSQGLTIYFDLDTPRYMDLYESGAGATWSQDTRWDEMLAALGGEAEALR